MTASARSNFVVATAGHVDHGKSSLLRALTGMETDRLEEERQRGLTIDLGFVWMDLPSGARVGFIDVPGHQRFIKTMIAGVGAIDACLFVVDAKEGWKPQSEEHLRIVDLLGVGRGVVALTKCDLVDATTLERTIAAIDTRLGTSSLVNSVVIQTSVRDGRGLTDLVAALDQVLPHEQRPPPGRMRMWIDRAFSIKGTGTVVTGTLTGGPISLGDQIEIARPRPGRRTTTAATRVRRIEVHGTSPPQAHPGSRVALALPMTSARTLRRGDCLTEPNRWHRSSVLDVQLSVAESRKEPLKHRGAYLVHLGCGEYSASLQILGDRSNMRHIEAKQTANVRLRLNVELPLAPGDRFVLRDAGRTELAGGGIILDVAPVLPVSRAAPDLSVDRVVREHGWLTSEFLEQLTGERRSPTVGQLVADPSALALAAARLDQLLAQSSAAVRQAKLGELERALLASEHYQSKLREAEASTIASGTVHDRLLATPFAPPDVSELDKNELALLLGRGEVLRSGGVFFASTALELAAARLQPSLDASPDGITLAELRTQLEITRKFAVPLAELLDDHGFTRRRGDRRVAGPRLSVSGADTEPAASQD